MTHPVHTYPESLESEELEHDLRLPEGASWSRHWTLPECPLCQIGVCVQQVTQGTVGAVHVLHGRVQD